MRTVFVLQARVAYQRELEGSVQYLCCCLLWTEILDVIPRICRSYSPSLGVTALSASIITGTAVAFTLHSFSSSSLSALYFWSFSFSFFLTLSSLGIATSITMAVCLRSFSYPTEHTEEVVYSGFGGYDCQDKKFHILYPNIPDNRNIVLYILFLCKTKLEGGIGCHVDTLE